MRQKLAALLLNLDVGLVERAQVVRQCLLTAIAGEHSLLIGPPGTAKSELARRLHAAFADTVYFERLLTRFTVPEELFGPLSIRALEEDRYERQTRGFMPDAGIAFIDEVFKANSAILNALLTLLNEREFDNGAGRIRCPLISAIGATNDVPDDEVGEAFFDRFLTRIPVHPVSDAEFGRLLTSTATAPWTPPDSTLRITPDDLAALAHRAKTVTLDNAVTDLLVALRQLLGTLPLYVSDRRWVKIVQLLRVVAASEERTTVVLWDGLLLPSLVAPDQERQHQITEWLQSRLGVHEAFSPPRLTRIVEAFEAQLRAEQNANDLDYDASGRLRFSADQLADDIGDAKGGSVALRMTHSRQRRYGKHHITARTTQIDALLARIARYQSELSAHQASLRDYLADSLWLDPALAHTVTANLAATGAALNTLCQRAAQARHGFLALPRLPDGDDAAAAPPPIEHEPLPA